MKEGDFQGLMLFISFFHLALTLVICYVMWVKEGGRDLMGQFIRRNLVNEGWKSSELQSVIQKFSRTLVNDLQRELKADKNASQINKTLQRSNNERKSCEAPPRPMSGPDLEARRRRPLPPTGRGPQLPEEVVKEFEDSMMDAETNIYQNVQRVAPLQSTTRNGSGKEDEVKAKTFPDERRTNSVDGSILSDVSLVIDVENVHAIAKEENLYESLENLNTFDLKSSDEVYYDDTMETATDIQDEEYYIEPLPVVGRCKALFDFEATTEENALSLFQGESLLVIESDKGDGWTRVKRERNGNQQLHDEGKVPTNFIEINLYDPKYAKAKKKSEYSNC